MCGKFTQMMSWREVRDLSDLVGRPEMLPPDEAVIGKPIAIGVIWEKWENRTEGTLLTFVMATTAPNSLIAKVTDRMPAIVQPEHWPLWLGETDAALLEVKSILQPFEGDWDMAEQMK